MRQLDTSQLKPIKLEPNEEGRKAGVVREALHSLSLDPSLTADERHAFGLVSYYAKADTLCRLHRLLK